MTRKKLFRLSLALSSICAICVFAAKLSQAATELARVNTTVITLEDFDKKFKENLKFFSFKPPTKTGVLDDLIKRELGIQEAKKLELEKDPDIKEQINTVLYHALLQKKLGKDFEAIKIADDEAKSYYAKNPEVRTSHIYVAVMADAAPEAVKKAQEKIKKIQADHLKDGKMSFAEVAQRFSEGSAAAMGGDIDYQTRDKLDPTYYATAVKLKTPGKISEIIRSQWGFHIIKLTGMHSWEDVDKGQVKRLLYDEKRNTIFEKYMADLRKHSNVTVNDTLIKE